VEELISALFALKKSMDKLEKAKQEAEPYRHHSFYYEEEEIERDKKKFAAALNGVIDSRISSRNKVYVIQNSICHEDYWSYDHGWKSKELADKFSEDEKSNFPHLPFNGEWRELT
jgi:hypothetical protein